MDHHHSAPRSTQGLSLTEKISDAFSQYGFMPHGHCYLWKPLLVWMHVISDLLIGVAYVSISVILYQLIRRINLPFNRVVLCFGVFIGACGMTHFMEIWNLWHADYWWSAWVKVLTAVASVGTGVYLFRLRHDIVALAESAKKADLRRVALEEITSDLEEKITSKDEEFEVIVNNIPQLAWKTDETGYINWYNQRWYDYTGTTLEEMKGWGWQKVHHPDHVEAVTAKFKHHIEEGVEWEDTFPLRGADGKYRWFLSKALPIRNRNGQIVFWFGTNTDVTEKKNAEIALADALRLRDEFLSIASHELKTPLTALKMNSQFYSKLLKNDPVEAGAVPRLEKYVISNEKTISRMEKLVDDMLDLSRIQLGKLSIEKEPFDIAKLIVEIVDRMSIQAPQSIQYSGPDSCIVSADSLRIEQVIVNLISNSIKYGDGKAISVELKIDSRIRVSVSDQGTGISPEDQEKIFLRFERANQDKNISGFGIGLFVSREIIEAHGGKISVSSELGKGSTFKIELPLS